MSQEAPARPGFRSRELAGKRVAFSAETEDQPSRPILLGQVYSFTGFPGQGFDEYWVKRIRSDFDPTFRPIMRRMVFRSVTGGEIWAENWGVARYTSYEPAPDWELKLLRQALMPRSGYFATLGPRPNLVDMWYPPLGIDEDGLPPKYWPFNGQLMYAWFRGIIRARAACREFDAFELLMQTYEAETAREQRAMDHEIDQRARAAVDDFPKYSTTNVRPTPRANQIQEISA